jgi:quercetin dioxygenase-like cupin family protein
VEAPGPLELWSWLLLPGEGHDSDPHPPGTVEIARVDEGTLTLGLDGRDHLVPAGSAASFDASAAHSYRNDGDVPLRFALVVSVPPPRP